MPEHTDEEKLRDIWSKHRSMSIFPLNLGKALDDVVIAAMAEAVRHLSPETSMKENAHFLAEAAHEVIAAEASERETEVYRARWLSCLTPEEGQRLRKTVEDGTKWKTDALRSLTIMLDWVHAWLEDKDPALTPKGLADLNFVRETLRQGISERGRDDTVA